MRTSDGLGRGRAGHEDHVTGRGRRVGILVGHQLGVDEVDPGASESGRNAQGDARRQRTVVCPRGRGRRGGRGDDQRGPIRGELDALRGGQEGARARDPCQRRWYRLRGQRRHERFGVGLREGDVAGPREVRGRMHVRHEGRRRGVEAPRRGSRRPGAGPRSSTASDDRCSLHQVSGHSPKHAGFGAVSTSRGLWYDPSRIYGHSECRAPRYIPAESDLGTNPGLTSLPCPRATPWPAGPALISLP